MLFNAIIPYMQGLDLYAIDFKYIYIFKKKKKECDRNVFIPLSD